MRHVVHLRRHVFGLAAPGVTAAMLAAHGVRLFSEREIDAADAWLRQLENAR